MRSPRGVVIVRSRQSSFLKLVIIRVRLDLENLRAVIHKHVVPGGAQMVLA